MGVDTGGGVGVVDTESSLLSPEVALSRSSDTTRIAPLAGRSAWVVAEPPLRALTPQSDVSAGGTGAGGVAEEDVEPADGAGDGAGGVEGGPVLPVRSGTTSAEADEASLVAHERPLGHAPPHAMDAPMITDSERPAGSGAPYAVGLG